jgi:hypothetical protein
MVFIVRHFRKYITNNLKVCKCGAGEGGGDQMDRLQYWLRQYLLVAIIRIDYYRLLTIRTDRYRLTYYRLLSLVTVCGWRRA